MRWAPEKENLWVSLRFLRLGRKRHDLILFTAQLSELVLANAPLAEGMLVMADDAPNARLRGLMLELYGRLSAGEALHEALAAHRRIFPAYYTELVKGGEQTGTLDEVLRDLEEGLIQSASFLDRTGAYLGYTGVVFLVQFVMATLLCIWVTPQFVQIYESMGGVVPWRLRMLQGMMSYVLIGAGILGVAAVLSIFLYRLRYELREYSRVYGGLYRVVLRIPMVGAVVSKRHLAHVAAILQKLLGAGVPMATALDDVQSLDVGPIFSGCFSRIREKVVQGESLASAMKTERRWLPASFRGQAALGEDSGLLPEAFGRLAHAYRREALKNARILLDIAAPVAICLIGLLTFFVYSAIFEALSRLSWLAIDYK